MIPDAGTSTDDAFGFSRVTHDLAALLDRPDLAVSVIAVTGAWGSGKTWVVKRARALLAASSSSVITLELNAWALTDATDFSSAFLAELGSQLKEHATTQPWWNLRRRHKLRRIGRRLRGYGAGFALLAEAAAPRLATAAAGLRHFWTPRSMAGTRADVETALNDSPGRIVVVIDDVDRLEGAELLVLLKLVRSVGQLPKIVYVIACDPGALARALPAELGSESQRFLYLQKFIELQWPVPSTSAKQRLEFLGGLLVSTVPEWAAWRERTRFQFETFGDPEYGRLVTSPRGAIRLANQMEVLPFVAGRELDLGDVLFLEAVRAMRPDVWAAVGELLDRLEFLLANVIQVDGSDRERGVRELHEEVSRGIEQGWRDLIDDITAVMPFIAVSDSGRQRPSTSRATPDSDQDSGRLSVWLNAAAYFRARRGEAGIGPADARAFAASARSGASLASLVADLRPEQQVDVPRLVRQVYGGQALESKRLGEALAGLPDDLGAEARAQWAVLLTDFLRSVADQDEAVEAVEDFLGSIDGMTPAYRAIATAVIWARQGGAAEARDARSAVAGDLDQRVAAALASRTSNFEGIDEAVHALDDEGMRAFWRRADDRILVSQLTRWMTEQEERGVQFGWGDRDELRGYLPGGNLDEWFGDSLDARLAAAERLGLPARIADEARRVVALNRAVGQSPAPT